MIYLFLVLCTNTAADIAPIAIAPPIAINKGRPSSLLGSGTTVMDSDLISKNAVVLA
jgi:hypothetical protein